MNICFSCSASEYRNIFVKCEQSAERMIAMFDGSSIPYVAVAKAFSSKMLEKIDENNFEDIKREFAEKYGWLVGKEFLAFIVFGKDEIGFSYKGIFSKGEAMSMLFVCDGEGKIIKYRFDPVY